MPVAGTSYSVGKSLAKGPPRGLIQVVVLNAVLFIQAHSQTNIATSHANDVAATPTFGWFQSGKPKAIQVQGESETYPMGFR